MARQIIWTLTAQVERREILTYWTKRSKSSLFSRKLNKLLISAMKDVSKKSINRKKDRYAECTGKDCQRIPYYLRNIRGKGLRLVCLG